MRKRSLILICALLTLALVVMGGNLAAQAQWKPTHPITVIVPWPAGGASDTTGRMIAGQMEPILGQRMVIVNTRVDPEPSARKKYGTAPTTGIR